jgi:uncharacterized membrane protein HdeD (DUF308 family)
MNTTSRTLAGGALLLLGLILGYNSFTSSDAFWVLLIYGILLMAIGIFIIFNKNEDKIEEVKSKVLKTKTSKKKR